MKAEKLCIFCVNCEWADDVRMGSSWTGEYGCRGFNCNAKHFSNYGKGEVGYSAEVSDIRALFLTAETCIDYKPADGGEG